MNRKSLIVLAVGIVLVMAVSGGLVFLIQGGGAKEDVASAGGEDTSAASVSAQSGSGSAAPAAQAASPAAGLPEEMRAMWISFLEWEAHDIQSEAAMRATAGAMFDNCAALGLNTVMVAVRPFSDALYKSEVYPWSHVLAGAQGADPGYDPLAVLVEEAHARGLRIEAWINPYRVQGEGAGPETLSADNPAVQNPGWVREINGAWYDPGLPEVRQLVVAGVEEIVQNYEVDGIHFDDYFYPEFTAEQVEAGEDRAFDEATWAAHGPNQELATWRRANVDTLVKQVYEAIKAIKPGVSFGISPQGNNDNNYNSQYSDVKKWMAEPGFVDYVMPQLYWGFGYRTQSGRDTYAFGVVSQSWAGYPRDAAVQLYAGLGAYRVGVGDGGSNDQGEWESGHNLADMVSHLRGVPGYSGFSLFRYDFLYHSDNEFAPREVAALAGLLAQPAGGQALPAESGASAGSAATQGGDRI